VKPAKTIDQLLKKIEVTNAGTETANGIYLKTNETIKNGPVWRKGNSHIQWWDTNCGWELYHDGNKGTCTYWTKGSMHFQPPVNPTLATW
jgi:hypothetical protein